MNIKIATEYQEGCAYVQWANTHKILRDYLIHIPNEGKRSFHVARQLKNLGMRKGVSDWFLPLPNQKYHGLWIELKRIKGSVISKEQQEWISKMQLMGYSAHFAYGADEAIKITQEYLHHI